MKLSDYPTLKTVKEAIIKLNEIGFPKFNGEENVKEFVEKIEKIIINEFGILHSNLRPIKQKEFNIPPFRVRALDTFTNINLIREHSYPPLAHTGMGRCNFPKFPVFYSSDNAGTSLIEVARNDKNPNKKYCISKWEVQPSENNLIFQTFLQTDLPPENNYKIFQEEIKDKINKPFEISLNESLDEDRTEGLIEYLTFLDSSFINDDNYSLSASLAHSSLYAEHNYRTDVLMYPSVQTLYKGINFAINPIFVENNLKLTRLYVVSLENYDTKKGNINITFYEYAEVVKNVITWKKILLNDEKYKKYIKEDFSEILNSVYEKQK